MGKIISITCEEILTEFDQKLRMKRGMSSEEAMQIVTEIRRNSQIVNITNKLHVELNDPDDNIIVECAVVGKASFIVSGDKHLLNLGRYGDIKIIKASDFLKLV